MGDFWKRVLRLEQRTDAQEPETYDLTALGGYLTADELVLIVQGDELMGILDKRYQADRRPEDGPTEGKYTREWLEYASDEELDLLDQAANILERALQEHSQPGNGSIGENGNRHAPNYKQKTRGRPWKN